MARIAAHLSTLSELPAAADEALAAVVEQLGGPADLAVVFASPDHLAGFELLGPLLCDRLGTECVIGCCGESIMGTEQEVEGAPALSLWAARLPGANPLALRLELQRTADGPMIGGWPDETLGEWPAGSSLLLVGDPFTFPADFLLERLNDDRPGVNVFGGMASAASQPGENRLLLGRRTVNDGAVAVLLRGGDVRPVVSQGCRPIGRPMVVTKAERNVIQELGGRPALAQLKELFMTLPTREQKLIQSGLHVGRVVNEYQETFEPGDFLIRNVVGIDPGQGAIAIGDYVRAGQTVQFHVRDQETADADLQQLLASAKAARPEQPAGALVFSCNGRGTRLFSQPNHDAGCVSAAFGAIPVAGFFAAGELGPIGSRNFMHGFTASIALFFKQ